MKQGINSKYFIGKQTAQRGYVDWYNAVLSICYAWLDAIQKVMTDTYRDSPLFQFPHYKKLQLVAAYRLWVHT